MHIYSHPLCQQHIVPNGHPENVDRLTSVLTHLDQCGLTQDFPVLESTLADRETIELAHPSKHYDFIASMIPGAETDRCTPLDPDTWASHQSLAAARGAAGAVVNGVDDLLQAKTQRVFCAVRPPGHHAETDAPMGFCLFNSIAIGACHALTHPGINRVAILDFDVHHGNGSVEIFKDNPGVLVCSSYQHPHYPNRMHDVVRDNIVHTPLDAGTKGDEFRRRIEQSWLPALEAHQPDLILVSAGFDAHSEDPLADINLLETDYAWVTDLIVSVANQFAQGRVLATLEGGYNLSALSRSVEAHLKALAAN